MAWLQLTKAKQEESLDAPHHHLPHHPWVIMIIKWLLLGLTTIEKEAASCGFTLPRGFGITQ